MMFCRWFETIRTNIRKRRTTTTSKIRSVELVKTDYKIRIDRIYFENYSEIVCDCDYWRWRCCWSTHGNLFDLIWFVVCFGWHDNEMCDVVVGIIGTRRSRSNVSARANQRSWLVTLQNIKWFFCSFSKSNFVTIKKGDSNYLRKSNVHCNVDTPMYLLNISLIEFLFFLKKN